MVIGWTIESGWNTRYTCPFIRIRKDKFNKFASLATRYYKTLLFPCYRESYDVIGGMQLSQKAFIWLGINLNTP